MAQPFRLKDKWRIKWTDADGNRRSAVFPDFKTASFELRKREHEVAEIKRGLRAPTPAERTFGELCDLWIERRATRKRSKKDDESIIRKHLRPALGDLKLSRIVSDAEPIEDLTERLLETLKPKTVSNILTLAKSILNLGVEKGWVLKAPKIWKPSVRVFDADFRYLRTEDELRRFLVAAHEEGENVHALYATAIYTGMRAGELAALEWSDIDLERRLITVQRSFDGPTKSKDLRYVPILDPLLVVLRAWRLRCQGRVVFPNERGKMQGDSSARIFQDIFHRVLERGGFEKLERDGKETHYVTFHCLRHTFASHWMMRGGELYKLQKILGHKSIAMTERYAHLAPTAFVADYTRLGGAEVALPAKVINLHATP